MGTFAHYHPLPLPITSIPSAEILLTTSSSCLFKKSFFDRGVFHWNIGSSPEVMPLKKITCLPLHLSALARRGGLVSPSLMCGEMLSKPSLELVTAAALSSQEQQLCGDHSPISYTPSAPSTPLARNFHDIQLCHIWIHPPPTPRQLPVEITTHSYGL